MIFRALAALAPLFVCAFSTQALVIDEFVDPTFGGGGQKVQTSNLAPGPVANQKGSFATILGGYRDLRLEHLLGTGQAKGSVNEFGNTGVLSYSNDTSVKSFLQVQWDGDDAGSPGTLQLGDDVLYNLAECPNWAFDIRVSTDLSASVSLFAVDVNGVTADWATVLPNFFDGSVTPGVGDFTYSGAFDWTQVDALELALLGAGNGIDLDMDVDYIRIKCQPIPEPGTLALLGGGLAVLVRRRRRR